MPVYQDKNISDYQKLSVWHITETKNELIELANNAGLDTTKLAELKHENRIKQWVATRLLLNGIIPSVKIIYNELGKPTLSNNWNISISHTNTFVAILINKKDNCGIDIEGIDTKVERIKHKYLNEIDLKNISSIKDLTLYWSAKEALYKYYGKKEVLFIENLFIENFSNNSNQFTGIINMPDLSTKLDMVWEEIDDSILVYTL